MIYSMTGFGRSEFSYDDRNYVIELKSLNGKNLDINLKIPSYIKSIDHEIRKQITHILSRGTVDCQIFITSNNAIKPVTINAELAKFYYKNISEITQDLGIENQNVLQVLMNMPEVVSTSTVEISDEEKAIILENISTACQALQEFRRTEGQALEIDLKNRIENITSTIPLLEPYENNRILKIREKMQKQLKDLKDDINYDSNRMEQEIIYYIEKLDISEEKQRLKEHCRLFNENISQDNRQGIGKKLNFILQEIGREINTLGSKANDSDIQKFVIEMKDELEKAKEQSLNVL